MTVGAHQTTKTPSDCLKSRASLGAVGVADEVLFPVGVVAGIALAAGFKVQAGSARQRMFKDVKASTAAGW